MAKNITKGLFLLIFVIVFLKCDHSKTPREYELFRVIDHLSEKNIIESPFRDLIKKFDFIQEEISGKWKYLPELSSDDQEIWGISTRNRILGDYKSKRPEGMRLLRNGKEVKYLSLHTKKNKGWRWIRADKELELKNYHLFNDDLEGIVLERGKSFLFDVFLPGGETVIEFHLKNHNLGSDKQKLVISFNHKQIKQIEVTDRKWYRVRNEVKIGTYSIDIKYVSPGNNYKNIKPIIIDAIKIHNSSDIVLLSKPHQKKRAQPRGKFLFQYYTADAVASEERSSLLSDYLYLYQMIDQYPLLDCGIIENPYSLKKKIEIDEYSLNSLAAPPRSEFRIPLIIPAGAALEFKYGFFRNSPRGPGEIINFKVSIEDQQGEKILFNRALSSDTNTDIFSERIDLSSYERQKVKLSFITEKAVLEQKQEDGSHYLPIWINPLIHRFPQEKNTPVILISLDTLRPDHLGCYGYRRDTSPTMDKLAQDGVLSLNTYSTTSWTLPGHVSMLTSLDCLHHQVYYPRQKMAKETVTLADILRNHQFFCAGFTGGGYLSSEYGFSKGFDTYQEFKVRGNKALRYDEAEYLAQKACEWIKTNKNKKFFLFIHTYQPHEPYANLSPEGKKFLDESSKWEKVDMGSLLKGKGRFNVRFTNEEMKNIVDLYDGEIVYTDNVLVKPVMDELKKWDLYDNAMIVITSDHGEEFYEHGAWLHDHSLYNEAIRIPLMIKFPNSLYKGKKIHRIVRITDIVPTILDQLNIKTNWAKFDGQSLLPFISGREKEDRVYICDLALRDVNIKSYPNLIAVNEKNFKLILNRDVKSPYVNKVSEKLRGMDIELYDTENDPKETKNLAAQNQYRDLCIRLLKYIRKDYEKLDKKIRDREEIVLDKNLKERLKALGYIK